MRLGWSPVSLSGGELLWCHLPSPHRHFLLGDSGKYGFCRVDTPNEMFRKGLPFSFIPFGRYL